MKSGIIHHPFTMSQGNFPRLIVSPVEVLNPENTIPGSINSLSSVAQWDTGADYCLISSELARNLRLERKGLASINSVEGKDDKRQTYLVNLVLPNGVFFDEVLAIEDDGLKSYGVDFLIGMAVINNIDFALTHDKDGNSILSISYPADRLVDFEKI